ncbi:Gfo/Idh/MocA family oxidoreductase [bacterium]|nr:MAG: Gfo/Idh/MocA family oxidoreductase [bacterium]
MNPLRFGLVGAGAISGAHVRALQSLAGKAELVAVADIDFPKAQALSETIGAKAYPSLDAMLSDEKLDVVNLCTPPDVHADGAVAAMRAGVHVIVEKPADVSVAATDRIIAAARETGQKATVIAQHRFDASTLAVRKAIQNGRLGRLTRSAAQVRWWRPQEYFDMVPWRGSMAVTGGGALMSQSIHTLDLMLWLMGEAEEVFAYSATLAHERIEVEDQLVATVKFRGGALGLMEASIVAYPGLSARIEVSGDRGSATIDGDRLTYFHAAEPGETTGPYGLGGDTNRVNRELPSEGDGGNPDPATLAGAHALQIDDFIQAVQEDRAPFVTLDDARATMVVIEAIHESAATGKPVRL